MKAGKYLGLFEISILSGAHPNTVRKWLKYRRLSEYGEYRVVDGKRMWLFDRDGLRRWIEDEGGRIDYRFIKKLEETL